ncbi:hypothetical protein [uncultured Microbacterium sp.]|uniref:hypothetical protein n=1 Tax=uncultured Microbacterium sp. TaxID=191216 RepID=UPI002631DC72|nr:hypothetical protein [uncultured Microbacterium sp.]
MNRRIAVASLAVALVALTGCSSADTDSQEASVEACADFRSAVDPVLVSVDEIVPADSPEAMSEHLSSVEAGLAAAAEVEGPGAFAALRDEVVVEIETFAILAQDSIDGKDADLEAAQGDVQLSYAEFERYCGS